MAIITYQLKNGETRFQVKVRDTEGHWFPSPSFQNPSDARTEELRLFRLKNSGKMAHMKDAKLYSHDDYWEVWRVENRQRVSAGWKISQDQMHRDYVSPVLGRFKLINVGIPEIGRVLNRMREMGLGEQTIKHVYTLMRTMYGDALDYYRMLPENPVKPKFHRPCVLKREASFLKPKEAHILLESVRDHYLGRAIWTQTLSGIRDSELQALLGKHIDWESRRIILSQAFNNKTRLMQDHPKQGDVGYAPLPEMLKEYLWERRQGQEDFVAPGRKGGMLSYSTYLQGLKRACERAGVPVMTTHGLRHTCSELFVQAGGTSEDVRRVLNHSTLSATAGYMHRTDDRVRALSERVGRKMFHGMFQDWDKESYQAVNEESRNVH